MSGNQNREVCARACERHGVIFNQQRTRESSGQQWTEWTPSECPKCQEETRAALLAEEARRKFETEVWPELREKIKAESDARRAADPEREGRVATLTDFRLNEAWQKYYVLNLPGFRALADSEDAEREDTLVRAEYLEKHLEAERLRVEAEDKAFTEKLAAEREEKLNQSLAGFASFG